MSNKIFYNSLYWGETLSICFSPLAHTWNTASLLPFNYRFEYPEFNQELELMCIVTQFHQFCGSLNESKKTFILSYGSVAIEPPKTLYSIETTNPNTSWGSQQHEEATKLIQ